MYRPDGRTESPQRASTVSTDVNAISPSAVTSWAATLTDVGWNTSVSISIVKGWRISMLLDTLPFESLRRAALSFTRSLPGAASSVHNCSPCDLPPPDRYAATTDSDGPMLRTWPSESQIAREQRRLTADMLWLTKRTVLP